MNHTAYWHMHYYRWLGLLVLLQQQLQLPATATGQLIKLKWRVATDNSTIASGVVGVRIDTITGIACTATAAGVQISGRVMTPDGRGLRNARVTMTDQSGITHSVTTSSFGYYEFNNAEAGQTYILSVTSRTFRFTPSRSRHSPIP